MFNSLCFRGQTHHIRIPVLAQWKVNINNKPEWDTNNLDWQQYIWAYIVLGDVTNFHGKLKHCLLVILQKCSESVSKVHKAPFDYSTIWRFEDSTIRPYKIQRVDDWTMPVYHSIIRQFDHSKIRPYHRSTIWWFDDTTSINGRTPMSGRPPKNWWIVRQFDESTIRLYHHLAIRRSEHSTIRSYHHSIIRRFDHIQAFD